jgi:hypothetical protein
MGADPFMLGGVRHCRSPLISKSLNPWWGKLGSHDLANTSNAEQHRPSRAPGDRLQMECEHLIMADRHLADGEKRVANQIDLIAWMIQKDHDITEAQKLLRNFEETLEQWHVHRQLILAEIARQEALQTAVP